MTQPVDPGPRPPETTDPRQSDAALLEAQERRAFSESRFLQFADASPDIIWMRDVDRLQWEYLSPAFERIYGLTREEALQGDNLRSWADWIVAEDREHALASIGRVRSGEQVTFEYRIKRPSDGEIRWLRDTDFPLRDDAGRVQRIGGFGADITAEKAADARFRESEGRQRALIEGVPQLVWRATHGGRWTWSSPQWTAYTGLSDPASREFGWLDAVHPDDREPTMAAWREAERTGAFEVECRILHADEGRHRWFQTRAASARDETGRIVEWLGASTDVDDLRRLQEEQQVLVAELQHRTRNLIAVVRSIAQQTMAVTGPTPEFQAQFGARMAALARVQGLLSRSDEEPVTLETLIRMELDALGGLDGAPDRVLLEGPEAPIRRSVVQTLTLALHELATNARKYGALAGDEGRLTVRWRINEAGGQGRRLELDWSERRPARLPPGHPERRGYGRELIERALPYALGARTTFEVGPEGVRCTLELPLDRPERRGRPA